MNTNKLALLCTVSCIMLVYSVLMANFEHQADHKMPDEFGDELVFPRDLKRMDSIGSTQWYSTFRIIPRIYDLKLVLVYYSSKYSLYERGYSTKILIDNERNVIYNFCVLRCSHGDYCKIGHICVLNDSLMPQYTLGKNINSGMLEIKVWVYDYALSEVFVQNCELDDFVPFDFDDLPYSSLLELTDLLREQNCKNTGNIQEYQNYFLYNPYWGEF